MQEHTAADLADYPRTPTRQEIERQTLVLHARIARVLNPASRSQWRTAINAIKVTDLV
jgi:hypothetical protein